MLTDLRYCVEDISGVHSPALLLFREILEDNVDEMIRIAGQASRLRPHCKTHKMAAVTRIELAKGIRRHKCATFAEAEMLADAGVPDVLLAYNLVGPNISRAVAFIRKFPDVAFSVTADHAKPIADLGAAVAGAGKTIDVLLDLDVGQHRTGLAPGSAAIALYRQIVQTPGLKVGGLHVYDGHQHQLSRAERAAAVDLQWRAVCDFRDRLLTDQLPVPRIVAGGTPTFPIYAGYDDPALELSPGTCVLNDAGYSESFPDLKFRPALVVLTRVVSRPTAARLTLDLGYKAVAADPPAGRRVVFPSIPDARAVLHNEEHLVLETASASDYEPGDELLAVPWHVCPTVALHKNMQVVSNGRIVDCWPITARDRRLTI